MVSRKRQGFSHFVKASKKKTAAPAVAGAIPLPVGLKVARQILCRILGVAARIIFQGGGPEQTAGNNRG
jgi:hypothetical protein